MDYWHRLSQSILTIFQSLQKCLFRDTNSRVAEIILWQGKSRQTLLGIFPPLGLPKTLIQWYLKSQPVTFAALSESRISLVPVHNYNMISKRGCFFIWIGALLKFGGLEAIQ